jgi:hypothetical protein
MPTDTKLMTATGPPSASTNPLNVHEDLLKDPLATSTLQGKPGLAAVHAANPAPKPVAAAKTSAAPSAAPIAATPPTSLGSRGKVLTSDGLEYD